MFSHGQLALVFGEFSLLIIHTYTHTFTRQDPNECTLEANSSAGSDHTPLSECSPVQNVLLPSQPTDHDDINITSLKSPHTETSLFLSNTRKVTIVNHL